MRAKLSKVSSKSNCESLSGSVFFRVACFVAQPRSNCRRSAASPPAVLDDAPVEVEAHAAAAGQQSTQPPPPATASASCASAAAGSPACPCSFTSPAAAPSSCRVPAPCDHSRLRAHSIMRGRQSRSTLNLPRCAVLGGRRGCPHAIAFGISTPSPASQLLL